ncbi:protein FAR1-RELATED SEQUENCE 5-like [Magnolia sinica]|uniref:protein FAR1-RELATED SEQUENCE 5-like n=1 Tax=Magnolia sinica TaxID=86752 RepID=UPI0026582208|nr:protein FAR1-RELATED SEQUENCE 5-like [Magnolia sinica]
MENAMNQDNALMDIGSQDVTESSSNQGTTESSMSQDEAYAQGESKAVESSKRGANQEYAATDAEPHGDEDHGILEGSEEGVIVEPYEGMEFESEEAARIFYNKYAMSIGFGSRISRNRRSRKDGETIARNFVCCKEGYRLRKDEDNDGRIRRHRAVTREGCGAMITVKKTNLGKWVVSKFVKEHNHVLLSPSEVRSLRSHRVITNPPKKLDAEIQVAKEMEMIESLEGNANLDPYEGMELESEDAARIFYSAYARRIGFRSRISKNRRSRKDGEVIARKFVCYKEGYRAKKHENKKNRIYRPRAVTREGCEAMIYVKKMDSGKWVITKFVKEHSHPLLDPTKMRSVRSNGNASDASKNPISVSEGERTSASEMTPAVGARSSGIINSGITEQDHNSNVQNIRKRKRIPGKDPQDVLDYLHRMQSENPAFFYATKVDEDQSLQCIFWVDARSRMAYNYFGDVVYFDTKYKMEKYEVPFAPFIGVNHHQQSTLFGCALLFDETESSYVWLFNTWLEAMSGRHPVTIITNQNEAMGAAIEQVLPKTHHCFCKWLILNEAPKQLSNIDRGHPTFEAEFQKCVNLTETVDEFESCWESLVHRFKLRKNEWLQSLYRARRKWVPAYLHDTFFGQQSEIINSFFDGYVKASTSFQVFVTQYERALANRHAKELEEDIRTAHIKPNLKTKLPCEKQAADFYTRTMFSKFQEEIFESLGYIANKTNEDGQISTYSVVKYADRRKECTVALNLAERRASCSCKMFEFSGILCRHALIVFNVSNITTVPSHYILERWTRNAKCVVGLDKRGVAMQANCRKSPNLRYSVLCKQAIRCAEVGATSLQDFDVAIRALREAWEKIAASKRKAGGGTLIGAPVCGGSQGDNANAQSEMDNIMNQITSSGPTQPKPRGRPRNSSSKANLEKATKNVRRCTICKEHGHDKSNCPRLRPIGSIFSNGGGMLVVDAGPSDLHGHGGIGGEQHGFSDGILGLSLGDHFDAHGTSGIHGFGPGSFFQINSLGNSRLLNPTEEFSVTGTRPHEH